MPISTPLGEAFVYGIPVDYISLSVTDVLSRTSIVVVALVLLIALKRLEGALAKRVPRWAREPLNTVSTWLAMAGLVLVLVQNPRLAGAVALFGLWGPIHLAYSYFRRKRLTPDKSTSVTGAELPVIDSRVFVPLVVIVLLVLACFFAFVGGNMRAATRERYLVSSLDGTAVMLVIYGDSRAVLANLPQGSKVIGDERILISIPGELREFVWKETGALRWERGFRFLR